MNGWRGLLAIAGLAMLVGGGCALLSRGTPLKPQYFDPLSSGAPGVTEAMPDSGATPECAIQIGDISASEDLGEGIAFRSAPHQIGYYESRRWSESPDNYLRRALERRMFDAQRCRRVLSNTGRTLDVRLLAFEEQRGPSHRARVAVHVVLSDDQAVLHEETIDWARPCPAGDGDAAFEGFVKAISQTLDDVVERVVAIVLSSASSGAAAGQHPGD